LSTAATVIVPTLSGARVEPLLRSLARSASTGFQVLVVDNGSRDPRIAEAARELADADILRAESNLGFSRAVNLAAGRAEGEALVLVNDDCTCDPGFVERIAAALDPGTGVVMAAGVMRDAWDPSRIDTAGIEVDRTLLGFDYLNGEPVTSLEVGVPDPVGPSGAAAAYDRDAFLDVGGFDENLFAYWEDVDLVLRLRRRGASCRLAADARGDHAHSASLGSGSARKDYLMGFGRGYLLRKWGVLSPRRVPSVVIREVAICAGQAVVDRTLAGTRGRIEGWRSAPSRHSYPTSALPESMPRLPSTLMRRWRRRARLRARGSNRLSGP
jgi:N-acetylglucosaminyl-diphospho-decaprenol L-rhamnosyltransferase